MRDQSFVVINVENLASHQRNELIEFLSGEGFKEREFEEAFFLFFCYKIPSFYKLRRDYTSKRAAEDQIDIVNDSYIGHDINDMIRYYEELLIFEVPKDSNFYEESDWMVVAHLACNLKFFRSPIIYDDVARRLNEVNLRGKVNSENIYYAVSSAHWKHAYLDLYRCLEAIYYLPWILKLKDVTGLSGPAHEIAKQCHGALSWRGKEDASIKALFDIAPDEIVLNERLFKTDAFKDISDPDRKKQAIGRRFYKIRNQLVHQGDYEEQKWTHVTTSCWPIIIDVCLSVVEHFYVGRADDIQAPVITRGDKSRVHSLVA